MKDEQPIVSVKNGQLRGTTKIDWKGGAYYSFQGIPYAKPPLKQLRFKAPQPAEPWPGVWDATKEGSECYSRDMLKQIVGAEDCLFLNVYTPELPTNQTDLKPVMVFIHGGGFVKGSGNSDVYGPDFLVSEDVVIVTINYRLGLLGFVCFEDTSLGIPGNAGLKDQVLALKWVQQNIIKFSGNPNNVTIFGESAGGSSVHYLMLSPMAKGLFHRAIAQSGSATSLWAGGQPTAPLVAKVLGLTTYTEAEIVKILTDLSVEDLLKLQDKIPDPFVTCDRPHFGPVIESTNREPMFLSEDPVALMESGLFTQVPLMIGYTAREGMLLITEVRGRSGQMRWNADFEDIVPFDLKLPRGSEMSKIVAEKIRRFYYGDEVPSMDNIDRYYVMQTDTFFFLSVNDTVRRFSKLASTPIYYYRMSIDTPLNLFKTVFQVKEPGMAHGDDLGYLFKNIITPDFLPHSPEGIAVQRIIKLWTTFARSGNPNPVHKDDLININWPPVQKGQLNFLEIGENLSVGVNPEACRVEFWDNIYSIHNTLCKL